MKTEPAGQEMPDVAEILERAGRVVTPVLRAALARLSPELRPVAEYHFGWADRQGHPANEGSGKFVRPALTVSGARAARVADERDALVAAAAVELVHNFSLVHDDVVDRDETRRHRPTAWSVFGVGRAVIVGDALATLAVEMLAEQDSPAACRAVRALEQATHTMIEGQADDMGFEKETEISLDRCLTMVSAKTGALLGCAASLGALISGSEPSVVGPLRRFGEKVGIAFQAVDDLLGIWGDPTRTGKPVYSDLRSGKKSIPIAIALSDEGGSGKELRRMFNGEMGNAASLERAAAVIEECGARAATVDVALKHMDAAMAELDSVPLDASGRDALVSLARFVVEREL